MLRKSPRSNSRINFLRPLAALLMGLSFAALAAAQSKPFPTYQVGENKNSTSGPDYPSTTTYPWVASDGTILTPDGTQVYLGITARAKDIALNPNTSTHTAAVLVMGLPSSYVNALLGKTVTLPGANAGVVEIFNTQTGKVLQAYIPTYLSGGVLNYDTDGSGKGIAYTPDGLHLLFSQDGNYGPTSYVTIAAVSASTGLITSTGGANPYPVQVSVPMAANANGLLNNVTCFPYDQATFSGSPGGTTGSILIPCGYTVSLVSDGTKTSYPLGIAITPNGQTAYVVLDNNDTLAKIPLSAPTDAAELRVGQVPNSVVISADGTTAYVSNEGGRVPTADDFQGYSNGTPVIAKYPTGSTATGTVSVVDLSTFTVTDTIETGLHPTGMAFWGKYLLVANTYSDSISVIDTAWKKEVRKIDLGLPIGVPGEGSAYGAGPNSIAVDPRDDIAYVALYNANAVAVVDLSDRYGDYDGHWGDDHDRDHDRDHDHDGDHAWSPILGMIPVGYAPSSVVLDAADNVLLVANDKGIGATGFGVKTPPCTVATTPPLYGCGSTELNDSTENSYQSYYGVSDLNTHEDLGTVSIVPIPNRGTLGALTHQVFTNNHWDLYENIWEAAGGDRHAKPRAIPEKIGDPSKIKHVFVIIRENRTYDQILGDVAGGNGVPALAVFGDNSTYAAYQVVTPNAHALVNRFPLLDNFYDPSRQSADGHNWITQAMAPYSDDIQSPDWLRDYPSNGGEALAYQKKGHLWDIAAEAHVKVKNYGEYIEYNTFTVPGCTLTNTKYGFVNSNSCEPTWTQFFNDHLEYEYGMEPQLQYFNDIGSVTPLPNLYKDTVQNYPQFDLNIPDQYRVDVWEQDFAKDVAAGTVPELEFMWISSDHTGGPPNATAMQADNDLALGRFVDIISHSSVWKDSVIFVEEDDAQNGVDHVDGHRSPGYVISPYVKQLVNSSGVGQGVTEDSTFYTQVNMTRTIEQILGLKPMNQNDLVASPMRTLFVDDPPADNFTPWTHVANGVPLFYGVSGYTLPAGIPASAIALNNAGPENKNLPAMTPEQKALEAAWHQKKAELFAGKYHTPDAEDPDTVNHLDWYETTRFMVPYPGEKTVRLPSDFNNPAPAGDKDDDDDGDGL